MNEKVKEFYNNRIEHFQSWANCPRTNYRLAQTFNVCGFFVPKKSFILEIGCGIGLLTKFLCEEGHRVEAYDISDVCLSDAKKRNKGNDVVFYHNDISEKGWKPQSFGFDVILFSDVIEHLPIECVGRVFAKAANSCKKKSSIIISCPSPCASKNIKDADRQIIENALDLSFLIRMCENQHYDIFRLVQTVGQYNLIVVRRDRNE